MIKNYNKIKKLIRKYRYAIMFSLIIICLLNVFFTRNSSNNNYSNFLNNKKVIIVGPAEHVNNGKFIDSFDVVIRVNKGHNMIKDKSKYGSRTDILYHCVSEAEEDGGKIPEDRNIKFIKFTFPKNNIYGGGKKLNNIKIKKNYEIVDQNKYLNFEKKIKTMPNAGTTAIWDILNYDIKSLHITGFTLFQSDYSKLYRGKTYGQSTNTGEAALSAMKRSGNHDQKNIARYYLDNVITDKRVTYDKEFLDGIHKTLSN